MAFEKGFGILYRSAVNLRTKDDECSLDKHFRRTLRLVVHQLELLAQNNGMGFVYARVPSLTKLCRKFGRDDTRERISQRTVEYALAWLRYLGIISPLFYLPSRVRLDGVRGRRGFLVINHDVYAKRRGKRCTLYPWGKDAFQWGIPIARVDERLHPEHPPSYWNESNRLRKDALPKPKLKPYEELTQEEIDAHWREVAEEVRLRDEELARRVKK